MRNSPASVSAFLSMSYMRVDYCRSSSVVLQKNRTPPNQHTVKGRVHSRQARNYRPTTSLPARAWMMQCWRNYARHSCRWMKGIRHMRPSSRPSKKNDAFAPTSDAEYDIVRELIKPFDNKP
jgi:hypothetical protein